VVHLSPGSNSLRRNLLQIPEDFNPQSVKFLEINHKLMLLEVFNLVFNQQAQWVKNYLDEVDRLQADVQNIEEISKSLPDGCWKRVQLEP
jgi:hypothetical protein